MTSQGQRSRELLARARQVIPLATQTMSKSTTQWMSGLAPAYVDRGRGAHVWDVDGCEWIDYAMALGPIILGYADERIDEAVRRQLGKGITFTLCHPLEVEVAEKIVALCPGVEAVRFGKSGSDALSAAVRVSRAATGRDHVLVAGYHGWHDWYIDATTRQRGVPAAVRDLTTTFPFGDLDALDAALAGRPAAAVIVEPAGAMAPPDGYLAAVVERCAAAGAVSVFDEVITGFRLAPGGARERYGVEPDISCYGKALGNGMPISAVAGKWSLMREMEEVFFSGTHGGEALSLAAASAVLDVIADGAVLAGIAKNGDDLRRRLEVLVEMLGVGHVVNVCGTAPRPLVLPRSDPDQVVRTWIQQCLLEVGCLFNGNLFVSASHDASDLDRAELGFRAAFEGIAEHEDLRPLLRGPVLEPVFRAP